MNTLKNLKWIMFGAFGALIISFAYGFTQMSNNEVGTPEKKQKDVIFASDNDRKVDNYKVFSPPTPADVTFAGEQVPMNIIDVREKLDRELLVNTYWHSNTFLMIKRANRWFPVIEPILAENNIPEDFKYLALIESGLTNAVSRAGATGFWQFMKETGKEYGLEVNSIVDERYHVEKSTVAACQYLQNAYDKFGSWSLVAASYNMGMGGVNNQLTKQEVESYFDLMLNSETGRYVYRILAVKEILTHSEDYGFIMEEEDLYQPYETEIMNVQTPIVSLSDFAKDQGINYKTLKILNPWMRKSDVVFKSKRTYEIKLPSNLDDWTDCEQ